MVTEDPSLAAGKCHLPTANRDRHALQGKRWSSARQTWERHTVQPELAIAGRP